MDLRNYNVICETENKLKTEYVFPSMSFTDCRRQALQHGLMGDTPVEIELDYGFGFITREEW